MKVSKDDMFLLWAICSDSEGGGGGVLYCLQCMAVRMSCGGYIVWYSEKRERGERGRETERQRETE